MTPLILALESLRKKNGTMEEGKETLALSTIRSLGKIQLKMTKLLTIAVKEDDRNDSK